MTLKSLSQLAGCQVPNLNLFWTVCRFTALGKCDQAMVGRTVRVLFEGESNESDLLWQGRMETQAPDIDGCVLINDVPEDFAPAPGEIVDVLITEALDYDMLGRVVA